MIYYTTIKVR